MGPLALSRVASLVLQPAYGQVRVPDELKKRAISASPAGVHTIWPRQGLASKTKTAALNAPRMLHAATEAAYWIASMAVLSVSDFALGVGAVVAEDGETVNAMRTP